MSHYKDFNIGILRTYPLAKRSDQKGLARAGRQNHNGSHTPAQVPVREEVPEGNFLVGTKFKHILITISFWTRGTARLHFNPFPSITACRSLLAIAPGPFTIPPAYSTRPVSESPFTICNGIRSGI